MAVIGKFTGFRLHYRKKSTKLRGWRLVGLDINWIWDELWWHQARAAYCSCRWDANLGSSPSVGQMTADGKVQMAWCKNITRMIKVWTQGWQDTLNPQYPRQIGRSTCPRTKTVQELEIATVWGPQPIPGHFPYSIWQLPVFSTWPGLLPHFVQHT